MRDYIRRFLIALIVALCVSLLFLGGKQPQAQMVNIQEQTAHWIWPSNGVITDVFGTRNGEHKGIDIAAKVGSPIYAVDEGVVSKSYYSDSYGHVVFLKHRNNTETVYAHLKTRNVAEGQIVKQGEVIGAMGNTGDSSGVHLHFEIHEQEWTFAKQNALNPVLALGDADVGKVITVSPNSRMVAVTASTQAGHTESSTNGKQSANESVHVVQQGETLWSIAQKYGTTIQKLSAMNKLTGDKIVLHQPLIIDSPANSQANSQYIVQTGDTLMEISRKTNNSVRDLKQRNHLTSDVIVPQQILIVQ
jgi:murein DD-endopeptidase MepM/ murein hydrolase activator NlpD